MRVILAPFLLVFACHTVAQAHLDSHNMQLGLHEDIEPDFPAPCPQYLSLYTIMCALLAK